jgi:membrane-associated phospholipid phosphatase
LTAVHPTRRQRARRSRGIALRLVTLGTAAFGALAATYLLSTQTSRGQRAENALLGARRRELRSGADVPVELLATISVWSLVATIAAVMSVALVRGRPRLALGAGAVIGGSIVTTEVLKKVVLPRPRLDPQAPPWLLDNIFPSGHTTIAVATAVAFVLVVPQRLRGPAALAGGFYAAAIAATTLEAGWHRTSDALGATFLVLGAALWACGLLVWWRGTGRPAERGPTWPYVILAGVATLGGLVTIVGLPRVLRAVDRGPLDSAGVDEAYAVSLALVAIAIALSMGVLLLALRGVSLDSPSADDEDRA